MSEWPSRLYPVLSRTFICNTKTWTQWVGCQEKIRSRRLAFTTKPTVFIDFSWWIPCKLCQLSGVKNHCFNTISFSLVYLFSASPDIYHQLIVAPEFILVSPSFESHAHNCASSSCPSPAQLKSSAKRQMQPERKLSSILSATPQRLTKNLEDLWCGGSKEKNFKIDAPNSMTSLRNSDRK